MLYKCDHCKYFTKRLCDLRRHENKKFPCYNKIKVNVCKKEVNQNNNKLPENVKVENKLPENVKVDNLKFTENVKVEDSELTENVKVDEQLTENVMENANNEIKCEKCNRLFSRKDNLKIHLKKCDGLDPKQCRICLKIFSTRQGKYEHMKFVKCNPPVQVLQPQNIQNAESIQNIGNIDNSVNTTNNITNNNTINLNFRGNFDAMTKEDIQQIINRLEKSEYIKMIQDNMKSGKYVVPRTIEHIYFNDNFPSLQTLKKERRNDKMVEVHVDGKWEKRLVDDILRKLMGKVEEYHSEYFKHLEDKYKDVPIGSAQWNKLTRPVKNFGHMMLWYNGFKGEDIEKIGIELNSPDDDKEKKAKNKDMVKIIKEKVYEQTYIDKEKDKLIIKE